VKYEQRSNMPFFLLSPARQEKRLPSARCKKFNGARLFNEHRPAPRVHDSPSFGNYATMCSARFFILRPRPRPHPRSSFFFLSFAMPLLEAIISESANL
jgi:hypothetical protein